MGNDADVTREDINAAIMKEVRPLLDLYEGDYRIELIDTFIAILISLVFLPDSKRLTNTNIDSLCEKIQHFKNKHKEILKNMEF